MPRDHASLVGSKSAFEKVVPSPVNIEDVEHMIRISLMRNGIVETAAPDLPPWRPLYHYFGFGGGRGSGSESMTPCANGCGRRPDERANPVAQCWTASRCGPMNNPARVAMMGPGTVRAQASLAR